MLPMLITEAMRRGDRLPGRALERDDRLVSSASDGLRLAIRVAEMPFSRDVVVDDDEIALLQQLLRCWSCFVMAAQHRLLLVQKIAELRHEDRSLFDQLHEAAESVAFGDVVDESDALLHYRYVLVYAVGDVARFEHCQQRMTAVFVLLRVINQPDAKLDKLLDRSRPSMCMHGRIRIPIVLGSGFIKSVPGLEPS